MGYLVAAGHGSRREVTLKRVLIPAAVALSVLAVGCGPAVNASEAAWPENAKKWFDRAQASYRTGDVDDAESAVENALRVMPDEPAVRLLAARIALAHLQYDRTTQLLNGVDSSDASSIRSRAYWYSGQVDKAADELEKLVADHEVRDTVSKCPFRDAEQIPAKRGLLDQRSERDADPGLLPRERCAVVQVLKEERNAKSAGSPERKRLDAFTRARAIPAQKFEAEGV